MEESIQNHIVTLDPSQPVWERVFMVAPLVVVGTQEEDGGFDLATKHMVMPLSWKNHVGFVCTPRHRTYHNIKREKAFTVSYLRPSQMLQASLAAAPRCENEQKLSLSAIEQFPASSINGTFVRDGYLYFECELDRIVDDLDVNSLIVGKIVAVHVHEDSLRANDQDDQDLIHAAPLLAYLHPGRFASIGETSSFPFPAGMKK